jgi:hypothetical protein
MEHIRHLLSNVRVLPDSQLNVRYRAGLVKVDLGNGRGQTVYIDRVGDGYVLTSVVLGTARAEEQKKDIVVLAERLWTRNSQTDLVSFTFDAQNRLVGRVDHPTGALNAKGLFFYLTRLAIECDRMEYLLTGENRF